MRLFILIVFTIALVVAFPTCTIIITDFIEEVKKAVKEK